MTDKEKIRAEVKKVKLIIQASKAQGAFAEGYISGQESVVEHLEKFIDSMQEEPASEKKCMFTKDSYTDEDRRVLCDDCKEKCEYSKKEEPISEDLEEAVDEYAPDFSNSIASKAAVDAVRDAFKTGAKWKEGQMMKNTIDAQCFGFQGAALFSFRLPADNYLVGSEVKVIVIKGD